MGNDQVFEGKTYIRLSFRSEKGFRPKSVLGPKVFDRDGFSCASVFGYEENLDFCVYFIPKTYINIIYIF